LPAREYQLVCVYPAPVHVPYLNAILRTLAKVEHDFIAQSILQPNGSYYVVPETSAIDGSPKAPYVTCTDKETQRKYELLFFCFAAHCQLVRVVVLSRHIYKHQDTSLQMQVIFYLSASIHGC
jgi:hypothetical protein